MILNQRKKFLKKKMVILKYFNESRNYDYGKVVTNYVEGIGSVSCVFVML